jgi:hypothetical protein
MKKLLTITAVTFVFLGGVFSVKADAVVAQDLNNTIVYPNPFEPRLGHTSIVFDNLTTIVRIRIYKITGELVFDAEVTTVNGQASWNATNNEGDSVATGVYVYLLSNSDGQKTRGKLVIVK